MRVSVLAHAGAHPARRDAVDTRIVSAVEAGTERIVDAPPDQLSDRSATEVAAVPSAPFQPSGIAGMLRIEAWLCALHREVGGPATADCPLRADMYRKAIDVRVSQRR